MDHDLRLTVLHGSLVAVDWVPWLAGRGPSRRLLVDAAARTPGLAYADADVVRERDVACELVVVPLAGAPAVLRAALDPWARGVGYRRLWLPDDVVELDALPGGPVATRCGSCAADFEEDDGRFWDHVRRNGRFPCACPWCGATVPQWTTVRNAVAAPTHVPSDAAAGRQGGVGTS